MFQGGIHHVKFILQYAIDPYKSVAYSYLNGISHKITSLALCRWRETFVGIPDKLNCTHMFRYLTEEKIEGVCV